MPPAFQKATKRSSKLRLALDGPSGAGKTWTALSVATSLADRVAVIDTEHGSASLYSDRYDFDVIELAPPFEPHFAVEAIKAAVAGGYGALVIDSTSHFWEAEGGVLDMVDAAAARKGGNSWAGWSVGTPAYRNLIDTILAANLHVICTMRSKTEWSEEVKNGKKTYVRVGTAPVMRAGIEYEFTVVGDIDLEHRIMITKSRCEAVADKVYPAHREKDLAETLKSWLNSGAQPADADSIADIRQAIAAIPDPDRRSEVKREFVAQFGMPDFLLADKTEEAMAFVRERTTGRHGQAGESDVGESGDPVDASAAEPGPGSPAADTVPSEEGSSAHLASDPSSAEMPPFDPDPEAVDHQEGNKRETAEYRRDAEAAHQAAQNPASWGVNDSVPKHENGEPKPIPAGWKNDIARRLARLKITTRDDVGVVLHFATNRVKTINAVRPEETEGVEEAIASLESGDWVIEHGVFTKRKVAS